MPDRDDAAGMMRLSMYTHAPGLNGRTACGIDQAWQIKSRDRERVDCPECLHIEDIEATTAGRPAQTHLPIHYTPDERGALCGAESIEGVGILFCPDWGLVNCNDCRHRHGAIAEESAGRTAESEAGMDITEREAGMDITEREQLRRKWTVAAVGGDTELGFEDWLHEQSARPEPRLHTPPRMEDRRGLVDGVFIFYDAHPEEYFGENSLEVVSQSPSGNVEITVGNSLFTLHHSDRADLLRALLHDFHYSPEVGGPGDD